MSGRVGIPDGNYGLTGPPVGSYDGAVRVPVYDKLAAVALLLLLVGVLTLAGLGRPVPEYISHAFTAGIAYLFRGGVAAANDYMHRERGE